MRKGLEILSRKRLHRKNGVVVSVFRSALFQLFHPYLGYTNEFIQIHSRRLSNRYLEKFKINLTFDMWLSDQQGCTHGIYVWQKNQSESNSYMDLCYKWSSAGEKRWICISLWCRQRISDIGQNFRTKWAVWPEWNQTSHEEYASDMLKKAFTIFGNVSSFAIFNFSLSIQCNFLCIQFLIKL